MFKPFRSAQSAAKAVYFNHPPQLAHAAINAVLEAIVADEVPVGGAHRREWELQYRDGVDGDAFVKALGEAAGLQTALTTRSYDGQPVLWLVGPRAAAELVMRPRGVNLEVVCASGAALAGVERVLAELTAAPAPNTAVHVLGYSDGEFVLMSAGEVHATYNPDNYPAEVSAAFERAVRDLRAPSPAGRLTLLEGPPGCGKSFWIRGVMAAGPGPLFVLVPPDMVRELGRPQLIPALMHQRGGRAVVLILEDADEALLARDVGNMGAVAALLNFGDGLLGEALDVRVVASTNARRIDLEPALLRPGRLAQHVHFGPLPPEHARRLLARLFEARGADGPPAAAREQLALHAAAAGGGVTLAAVYAAARAHGWTPPPAR